MSASPYQILAPERLSEMQASAQARGINPKLIRPDGSVEDDASVPQDVMRQFLIDIKAVEAVPENQGAVMTRLECAQSIKMLDGESGKETVETRDPSPQAAPAPARLDPFTADGAVQQQVFAKVARYLDPKLQSPITLITVRHKVFVMGIPTSQEMLDVTAFTGAVVDRDQTVAEQALQIVGECLKACRGWAPENSPDAQLLRAHINDPTKWPVLRKIDWLASRDGSVLMREAYPLYGQYRKWRTSVEPTPDEIDFYYSRLG